MPDCVARQRYERRLEVLQRAERFWTLAAVSPRRMTGRPADGRHPSECSTSSARSPGSSESAAAPRPADFRLLSQVPYRDGQAYGPSPTSFGLIDSQTFDLAGAEDRPPSAPSSRRSPESVASAILPEVSRPT